MALEQPHAFLEASEFSFDHWKAEYTTYGSDMNAVYRAQQCQEQHHGLWHGGLFVLH